jgi:phosphatidylglycerophosphate synthase
MTSYAIAADQLTGSGVLIFGRALMYTIMNVYAVRMAGVFMISLGTIWFQSRAVPRSFVFVTYALALLLLVAISFSLWMVLIFPAWVFVISVYILRETWRGKEAEAEGFIGSDDAP